METSNQERTKELAFKAIIFVFVLFAVAQTLCVFLHLNFHDPLLLSGIVGSVLRGLLLPERKRSCVIVIQSEQIEQLKLAVGSNPDVHFPQTTCDALKVIEKAAPKPTGAAAIGQVLKGV